MIKNQKETIDVKVKDPDTYTVKRVFTEEMDGDEVLKIYGTIEDGEVALKKQLEDIPKVIETQTESINKQLEILAARKKGFQPFMGPLIQLREELKKAAMEKEMAVDQNNGHTDSVPTSS